MNYLLISVGEAENLKAAIFQQAGPLMQLTHEYRAQIYVALLPMLFSSAVQRRSVEAEIINRFLPGLRTYKLCSAIRGDIPMSTTTW